jgi:hypothetical protein
MTGDCQYSYSLCNVYLTPCHVCCWSRQVPTKSDLVSHETTSRLGLSLGTASTRGLGGSVDDGVLERKKSENLLQRLPASDP